MLTIEISNRQSSVRCDARRMHQAAEAILRDAGVSDARLSLAVVDDPTIHQLNRRFLDHDFPTDVLSFLLEREGDRLEGEVIVSADTAARAAAEYAWPADDELLLYVIHGTLHLVGHDDASPDERAAMREQERRYLVQFGLEPPAEPQANG
ncbi:MAG: rRNA maturation RNase YbeY [Pirellulales bacterium]